MITYTTAGESHGRALVTIIEGLPAGIALDEDLIRTDLARRQLPLGAGERMNIETDRAQILSGVMSGRTTGAPIALMIENANHAAWRGKSIAAYTRPRPSHADEAAAVKYGYDDVRPALERASARETAARVAAGACARAFLSAFNIRISSEILALGGERDEKLFAEKVAAARAAGDTLGGLIRVTVRGLPVGLGSHVSATRRLDARLAAAVISVPAIKGVEFGDGFALAASTGTQMRGKMGGITGGITDGEDLIFTAAMKPIPTTLTPQPTHDLATGQACETSYERSDVCPVPRAAVILEAVAALVIADALAEKLGGDSLAEMLPRFAALPRSVTMSAAPKVFWP